MASDDPRYFFETFLRPNSEDWAKEPQDIRLAMNTAVSANQLADWCVNYWAGMGDTSKVNNCLPSNVGAYRDFLTKTECRDFALIRDITESHKHLEIKRTNRVLSSAAQTGMGSLGWGEGGWGEGVWGGGPQLVVILDNGTKRAFSAPMENVLEMWKRLLADWGL